MAPTTTLPLDERIDHATIHHIDIEADAHFELRYERAPTPDDLDTLYTPTVTFLDVDSVSEAYKRADRDLRGAYRLGDRRARFPRRSAMPSDVVEVVTEAGGRRLFKVAPVGFEEVDL